LIINICFILCKYNSHFLNIKDQVVFIDFRYLCLLVLFITSILIHLYLIMKIIILNFLRKWKEMRLKPFDFCCSIDYFDPLSRYDQRKPPYKSSLAEITSVHECPVSKIQTQFFTPLNKKKLTKNKILERKNKKLEKLKKLHDSPVRKERSIKWHLEDEFALAKDIFWTERQRIYNEESDKAARIGKKRSEE